MKFDREQLIIFVLTGILFIGFYLAYVYFNTIGKEEYGGPINGIKIIPKSDCYKLCNSFYNSCVSNLGPEGAYRCMREKESCISECNYASYLRT